MARELSVFESRARRLAQDIDVLRQQEIRLTETLGILTREVNLTRNLYKQKVVPEIEMLRLERQLSEMRGQLAETKSKIEHTTAAFRSQSEEDLAKSRADLAVLEETIKSAQRPGPPDGASGASLRDRKQDQCDNRRIRRSVRG